jgi:NADH-quinone oxidoreductase subunit N
MSWSAAALEVGTLALAVAVLALDLAVPRHRADARRSGLFALAGFGLMGLLAWSFVLPHPVELTAAYVQDGFALLIKRVMLASALLAVVGMAPYATARRVADRAVAAMILLLFAAVGGMALASAREFLTLFVAFELVSLPLYVLAGIEKERRLAPEGAMKIFLFGSVSSAILLLGIALLFAATGSTFWSSAASGSQAAAFGAALLLAGFGFKIAAFPFSLWVPDTYQAAPTPVVAFLSVAPKAAAVAALFRLSLQVFAPMDIPFGSWIAVLAALAMIVGNLLALRQSDLKRLLAFSGIAQIGYVLAALAAGTRQGAGLALFFFVAYLLSNGGAFLAVAAVECCGEEPTLEGVRNLLRRAPLLAASLLVFLLSLGGIPFVIGFWGKMYVFLAAAQAGLFWLVALGALLAVVALYYYLNVARAMLMVPDEGTALRVPTVLLGTIVACAIAVAGLGVVPQLLAEPCLRAADTLSAPLSTPAPVTNSQSN